MQVSSSLNLRVLWDSVEEAGNGACAQYWTGPASCGGSYATERASPPTETVEDSMPPRAAPSLRITTSWLTMTLPTPEAALLVGRTRLKFLRHGADEAQCGVVLAQRAFYGSPRVVPRHHEVETG